MENIRILKFEILKDQGPLKALVDVEVDGWTLRFLRFTWSAGRPRGYVSLSRTGIKDLRTGVLSFESATKAPPEVWAAIENAVIEKYEKEMGRDGTVERETA